MKALRDPDSGCPWDLEQDFASIAPYTLEEAYEVADVIERRALDELPDELGDLLLQVVFHAQMASEQGLFAFPDVVHAICEKMVRRHPHVFGSSTASNSEEVVASWESIKQAEKPASASVMDGITLGLPALSRARKIGKRAAAAGFDWSDIAGVRAKISEELAEVDEAMADAVPERIEAEIGDLLFSVVNLCRHLNIDPERALRRCNETFIRRFAQVEAEGARLEGGLQSLDEQQLDAAWQRAKKATDEPA